LKRSLGYRVESRLSRQAFVLMTYEKSDVVSVRNKHTQIQQEVRTLLIRDAAVCVIGVFAGFEIDD